MISTAKLFAGCVTSGVTLVASLALAAPPPVALHATVVESVINQKGGDGAADRRREADDLLRNARQAMKEGKLDAAEDLVARAEKLHVASESIFARFVDTPEKVRKDLAGLRSASGTVSKPSSRFVPSLLNEGQNRRPGVEPNSLSPRSRTDATERLAPDAAARSASALSNGAKSAFSLAPPDIQPDATDRVPPIGRPRGFAANGTGGDEGPPQSPSVAGERGGARFADPNYSLDGSRPEARVESDLAQAAVSDSRPNDPRGDNSFRPNRLPQTPQETRVGNDVLAAKREALRLVALARAALDRGDIPGAQQYVTQAQSLPVPLNLYGQDETSPWQFGMEIDRSINRRGGEVVQAGAVLPENPNRAGPNRGGRFPVAQGVYNPTNDRSRVTPAQAEGPTPADRNPDQPQEISAGQELYEQGLRALGKQDRETAMRHFREAWKFAGQLDPNTRQQLRDKLNLLQGDASTTQPTGREPSALEAVDAKQTLLQQKLRQEMSREIEAAQKIFAADPRGALQRVQRLRDRVNEADLDPPAKKQLLTLVDRELNGLEKFIETNRGDIDNTDNNVRVQADVDRRRRVKSEVQNKVAELVEQFNTLMDERRFPEAEVLAHKARELDPDNPVVETLMWKAKFAVRIAQQKMTDERKENGFIKALQSVDDSSIPEDDREPIKFMDATKWADLSRSRRKWLEQNQRRMSPAEMEIQKSLKQPVEVQFNERPLKEVIDTLARTTGINFDLDPQGLAAEGITSDAPVSIDLHKPISLRSALNLILGRYRLSYVIQNEVLRITSEHTRDANVYPKAYDVADLVIPIPNFMPGYNTGLPSAILEAHRAIGYGSGAPIGGSGPLTLANNQAPAGTSSSVLAQIGVGGMGSRSPQQMGPGPGGPGGLGGGGQADFDTLIDLVTSTVAPSSWNEVGGPGSIESMPSNLSIVVSQTQEVHDQIADLLEQLRRLQDLQVTVEVRFITLRDNFFERMGIDFDFQIDDNTGLRPASPDGFPDDAGPRVAIGLNAQGLPTADLDYTYTHGSRGSFLGAVPQFGGFDANTAAHFGFAILSDIEVFFLVQASQGDRRNNVLQAPKVTLFNGQSASVNDTAQRPFVVSIIPVVGDFAAAHQPVIVVLNEGTSLSVQAVVTADRRFVRLTLVPFFSRIGNVDTFTFSGKTTTTSGTNVKDPANDKKAVKDNVQTTTEGTTVQLPTFAFTTVTTTVSVPDGGTVLLGGIKRLREGRDERGVPMLNKIPYISRLFKNVAIGRETESLMLMVTPRIIIQEEEEQKLGLTPGS